MLLMTVRPTTSFKQYTLLMLHLLLRMKFTSLRQRRFLMSLILLKNSETTFDYMMLQPSGLTPTQHLQPYEENVKMAHSHNHQDVYVVQITVGDAVST